MKAIHINGNDLTFEELRAAVYDRTAVILDSDARERVALARGVVEDILSSGRTAYAITTGVGKLSDVRITSEQNKELQLNLLRSHAVGVGEPLNTAESRAMMLLRANSLAKGNSGVRPDVIDLLCNLLNRGVHPIIPSQGSVGASGDLAPLAHQALVLIGEGEAEYEGKRMPGTDALKAAQLAPLTLEAKEAISLINGTQAMLAVGSLALLEAQTLADSADVIASLSLDALRGTDAAFDERIHAVRPHAGQVRVAARMRKLLEGSSIRASHIDCKRVQDAYSLRCIPQVHGAVLDTLAFAQQTFAIEMNAAVDNPLIFPTAKEIGKKESAEIKRDVISGGNFHGEPLAFALDYLAIVLTALAGISERRVERLVNPALNEGLPAFLTDGAGLRSGFMMPQVTAAALVSENKVWAHPASVDSITTSGNKEDYVSMGMTSALKLKRVVANTRMVLAIEAATAAQALDFLAPLEPGTRGKKAKAAIREVCAHLDADRSLAKEFNNLDEMIKSGKLLVALD